MLMLFLGAVLWLRFCFNANELSEMLQVKLRRRTSSDPGVLGCDGKGLGYRVVLCL